MEAARNSATSSLESSAPECSATSSRSSWRRKRVAWPEPRRKSSGLSARARRARRTEELGDGPGERRGERHERPHRVGAHIANGEGVARAHGLRDDLTKEEHERDAHDNGHGGRNEVLKEDWQRLHGRRVAQQQRHEQQVVLAQ